MEIGFLTDIGCKRRSNQDAVGVYVNQTNLKLAMVADGMGGHQAGDIASQLTISDLGKAWESSSLSEQEEIIQWLLKNIQAENELIYEKGQTNPEQTGMGTTLVALVLLEDSLIFAHVGDSRFYLIREGNIKQLTDDHSLVNELVKSGEITLEMAQTHPRKNVLVRSIGMPGLVEIDVTDMKTLPGDILLVCSDGLTNMVSDDAILKLTLDAPTLEEALSSLVNEANEAGGVDNITVLLAKVIDGVEEVTHD